MIFIVFDIEIIFLYPCAVIYRALGAFGLVGDGRVRGRGVRLVRVPDRQRRARLGPGEAAAPARPAVDRQPDRRRARSGGSASEGRERRPTGRRQPDADRPRVEGLEGLDHNFLTGKLEDLVKWARPMSMLAGHVRPRLLRHRDDGHRRRPLRPRPLRHGGLPGLAPPGRPHDRRRPGVAEDGAGAAPDLRPDDGAQVGHLDGRVRLDAAGCSTTTPSCRASTRSSRSTSTPRAARPVPRR